MLDPREPLLQSERTQGFAADPDHWKGEVFAYAGLPQNLKDLKVQSVLLNPRDPLLQSERMQGFAADPVYAKGEVFAFVGLPQNLKDLKATISYSHSDTPKQQMVLSHSLCEKNIKKQNTVQS